jgi:diguanylate cyclase
MDEKEFMNQTLTYVRLALPLMSKHNIPITPSNYAVWYKYFSFGDLELNRIIDQTLKDGGLFSKEFNETLFQKFCTEKDENELSKIKEELRQVLVLMFNQISDLTGHTDEYEQAVTNSVNKLSNLDSINDIREVVLEIVEKTKTLGQFGKSFSQKLKEATEALEELKKDFEQVRTEATLDPLTGLANRKLLNETLATLTEEAAKEKTTLSLLLTDIDHFKRFNDEHGHLIGDEVLKFVAKKIKDLVKGGDLVARFGGEEFAVILPGTSLENARIVAENIRGFFAKTSLKTKTTSMTLGNITVSIGISALRTGESLEALIQRADQALYQAKNAGRNRIVDELGEETPIDPHKARLY